MRIMSQEGWPFENRIRGVAVRNDFPNEDCDWDPRWDARHEEGCAAEDETAPEACSANDVFIVEGEQERYGSKAAWEVCRRA